MEQIQFLDGFDPTPKLTKVARIFIHFFTIQQLATHGDHLPTVLPVAQEPQGLPPAQRWEQ